MNFGQGKVSESQGISFWTKSGHPEVETHCQQSHCVMCP